MPTCFVRGCRNSDKRRNFGVTFHSIPKKSSSKWLKVIGRDPTQILVNQQRVCSEHFKQDDFETAGLLKRIKPNVIPSVNLETANAPPSPHFYKILPKPSISYVMVNEENPSVAFVTIKGEPLRISPTIISNKPETQEKSRNQSNSLNHPEEIKPIPSDTNSSLPSPEKTSEASLITSLEANRIVKAFHSYSRNPEDYFIELQKKETIILKRKYQNLVSTNKKQRRKIFKLKAVIRELQKRFEIAPSDLKDLEDSFNDKVDYSKSVNTFNIVNSKTV